MALVVGVGVEGLGVLVVSVGTEPVPDLAGCMVLGPVGTVVVAELVLGPAGTELAAVVVGILGAVVEMGRGFVVAELEPVHIEMDLVGSLEVPEVQMLVGDSLVVLVPVGIVGEPVGDILVVPELGSLEPDHCILVEEPVVDSLVGFEPEVVVPGIVEEPEDTPEEPVVGRLVALQAVGLVDILVEPEESVGILVAPVAPGKPDPELDILEVSDHPGTLAVAAEMVDTQVEVLEDCLQGLDP